MKRLKIILLVVLVILAAAIGAIYIFIPAKITVSKVVTAKIPVNRVADFFMDKELARKWIVGKETDSCFCDNAGTCFCFLDNGSGNIIVRTQTPGLPQEYGYIYLDRFRFDSAAINWTITYPAVNSPFARVKAYLAARKLKKYIAHFLDRLIAFSADNTRIYGFQPVHEMVKDTLSLSQKKVFDHYPLPQETDTLLQQLRQYILQKGATITRPAMMHVLQTDKERYEVMVALPIDQAIPDAGNFVIKRMPHGKIISATVTGGMYTVRKSLQQLEQYKMDNVLTSPAIPYQSMVTNRVKEPDTAKWVTVLYYPVF